MHRKKQPRLVGALAGVYDFIPIATNGAWHPFLFHSYCVGSFGPIAPQRIPLRSYCSKAAMWVSGADIGPCVPFNRWETPDPIAMKQIAIGVKSYRCAVQGQNN
jgi:hypothetical protein